MPKKVFTGVLLNKLPNENWSVQYKKAGDSCSTILKTDKDYSSFSDRMKPGMNVGFYIKGGFAVLTAIIEEKEIVDDLFFCPRCDIETGTPGRSCPCSRGNCQAVVIGEITNKKRKVIHIKG